MSCFQHYRFSTVGLALQEVLDEMVEKGTVCGDAAAQLLLVFDQVRLARSCSGGGEGTRGRCQRVTGSLRQHQLASPRADAAPCLAWSAAVVSAAVVAAVVERDGYLRWKRWVTASACRRRGWPPPGPRPLLGRTRSKNTIPDRGAPAPRVDRGQWQCWREGGATLP